MFRLLLVEDDPMDAALMVEALRESQIVADLKVARGGAEALAMLRHGTLPAGVWRPDLVLCDLRLPGLGGHELLRQLKSDSRFRSIPVVIMSSSLAPLDVARSQALEAYRHVLKPSDFGELCTITRNLYESCLQPPGTL